MLIKSLIDRRDFAIQGTDLADKLGELIIIHTFGIPKTLLVRSIFGVVVLPMLVDLVFDLDARTHCGGNRS